MLARIRDFFASHEVLEVVTPVLGHAAGTDPALEPFHCVYRGPGAPSGLTLYLQTSPEFHMKRLLAAGSGPIYQISHAFRNGESGARHNPEFTLLEWYRPGFDHHQLMKEVAELASHVLERQLPVTKSGYAELFQRYFSWDPLEVDLASLEQAAREHGIAVSGRGGLQDRDQWLDLLMSHVIEPQLGQGGLDFVYDYPASQAALARLDPADPRVANRFELYYCGLELANGFYELIDAAEQLDRFRADNVERERNGQPALPIDMQLIDAMEYPGLPDCAGVALGLDRLLMLNQGAGHLQDAMCFPLERA